MKIHALLSNRISIVAIFAASLIGFGACKGKSKPEGTDAPVDPAPKVVVPAEPVEIDPSGYNSKRTQAFGFLSRMPATTEGAIGIRNLSDVVGGLLESNTFKRASAIMEDGGFELDSLKMGQEIIDNYVGKELFLIMAQGSAEQFGHLQLISKMMSEMSMRSAGEQLAGGGAGGGDQMAMLQQFVVKALKDENSELSKALEEFQFPPMILGSKLTDGADEVIATLKQMEDSFSQIFTVSRFEAGGGKFNSWRVNLQDVFTSEYEDGLNEFLEDKATSARVAAIIRKKKIEFSFGVMDNYLVFGLGSDHKHLEFVSQPQESILATKRFAFTDQFLDKKLVAYSFMSKAMLAPEKQVGQIQHMADSLASGLASGGPAMRKLGDLVKKLGAQMEGFAKRGSQTYIALNYMDKGIHSESIGGYTSDVTDLKAKSIFANAAPADAALVISQVANPQFREPSIAMMETLFSAVEVGVHAWAESSGDDSALQQFGGAKEMFGGHLSKIWGILKGDFLGGLGSQSGIIVDLKGGMPKGIFPIPKVLVDEGKVPRIALAADVTDRAKLAAAWEQLVPAIDEASKVIPGQEPGKEFQLPGVVSLNSPNLDTHHFSFAALTPDFMPSISLNDELFFLSSSKQFSEGLAASVKAGSGNIRGTYVMMNFNELHGFIEGWVNLGLRNVDTLFKDDEFGAEQFKQTAGQIQMGLEFTRGIRGFRFNRYIDDAGDLRASWHLHIEDLGAEVE